MELQEGIQKVLTKLAGDSALQNELKKDPETVIKNAAGDGLEAGDLDKIISGAKNISADSRKVVAFTGLLGVPTCIPGLARLLSQTGGYDLLMGYIARDETSAGPSIRALGILTQLLGSSAGRICAVCFGVISLVVCGAAVLRRSLAVRSQHELSCEIEGMVHRAASLAEIEHGSKGAGDVLLRAAHGVLKGESLGQIGGDGG